MCMPYFIVVCVNRRYGLNSPSCAASGAVDLAVELERQLAEVHLSIEVRRVECLGQCARGPNLRITPGGSFYHEFGVVDITVIIAQLQRLTAGP